MKKLLLIAALIFPLGALAQCAVDNSLPSNLSGFNGSGGPSGFTAISGTAATGCNSISTASVDYSWAKYNTTVGYAAASGGNQSTQDMIWIGPHECESGQTPGPTDCEIIFYWHGGGGYSGTNGETGGGDPFGTSTPMQMINMVLALLGRPNRVGGHRTAFIIPNYRETVTPSSLDSGTVSATTSLFPAQWQDAKCAIWYADANQSTFPGNYNIVGLQGGSWGGSMVFWAGDTPDNAYTASCSASAPSTDPIYFSNPEWPAAGLFGDSTGSITSSNGMYYNTITGVGALLGAATGQLYLASDTTISQYYPPTNPTTLGATLVSHAGGFTNGIDPDAFVNSSNLATLNNFHACIAFGTPTNVTGGGDTLIRDYCNTNGITTGCSGGAPTGQLYNLAELYASSGAPMPFMQILNSCGTTAGASTHECDLAQGTASPTWSQGTNCLLGSNVVSSTNAGGNAGGS